MYNLMKMQFPHSLAGLPHKLASLLLLNLALFLHILVQIALAAQLHQQVYILVVVEHRVQFYDVTVVQERLDFCLLYQLLDYVVLFYHCLVYYLYGKQQPRLFVLGHAHVAEFALPEVSAQLELAYF